MFYLLLYFPVLHQEISLKIKMNCSYFTSMQMNTFKYALK